MAGDLKKKAKKCQKNLIFYRNFQCSYVGRKSRKSLNAIFFFSFRFGAYSLKFTVFALQYPSLLFFLLSFRENSKFSVFSHFTQILRASKKLKTWNIIFFIFALIRRKMIFFCKFSFFLIFNFPRKTKKSKIFAFFASIFYKKNHFFLRFRAKVKKNDFEKNSVF